eukprot:g44.t1
MVAVCVRANDASSSEGENCSNNRKTEEDGRDFVFLVESDIVHESFLTSYVSLMQNIRLCVDLGNGRCERIGWKKMSGTVLGTLALVVATAGLFKMFSTLCNKRMRRRRRRQRTRIVDFLHNLHSSTGHVGVDIGGSLAKLCLATPTSTLAEAGLHLPTLFKESALLHANLRIRAKCSLNDRGSRSQEFVLHFLSGSTHELETVVKELQDLSSASGEAGERERDNGWSVDFGLAPPPSGERIRVRDVLFGNGREKVVEAAVLRRISSRSDLERRNGMPRGYRKIVAAGGGAHKLQQHFRDALGVELCPMPEMRSVVDGLLLLHAIGADDAIFALDESGEIAAKTSWPDPLFPFLLVNVGSGVSVLRVDDPKTHNEYYRRVGGTACGGATFVGLARLLTGVSTFQDALELASKGDAHRCDTLVRDIYGDSGSASLGLPGSITAASFGKFAVNSDLIKSRQPEDVARALLEMVTQASSVLARTHARQLGVDDGARRVFFSGGFLATNPIAQRAISKSFGSLGGRALFNKHTDFLGAIGSLVNGSGGLSRWKPDGVLSEAHPKVGPLSKGTAGLC